VFSVRDVPRPLMLHSLPIVIGDGPALTGAAGRGLPKSPTAVVGREDDIAALAARVTDHRLTTIVGFGGTGKTRLAIEVAERWLATTGHVAHFVDLTSADDPVAALADAIGLPPAKLELEGSPYPLIARHLGVRPTLVVIDNCEHVIDDAAAMCESLVAISPTTTVLATSRESLELHGEAVYQLGGLSSDDAAELLRSRAELVGVPSPDEVTMRRLVDAVDALPLGIELVVARLRQIPADELAGALENDLDALRSRRRRRDSASETSGSRHATLRSVIEWSVRLLGDDERTLLYRLSRLPAAWTRDTAARLGPEFDGDLVDELAAKSLVTMDREGRLRMLETVRQFCDGQLTGVEADEADDALVAWALAAAPPVTSVAGLSFDDQRIRVLSEQAPNFRAALRAAERMGRAQDRAAILTGLWPLVVDARARSWFDAEVLDALRGDIEPPTREILLRLAFQGQVGEHVDTARQMELVEGLRSIDPEEISPVWSMVRSNEAIVEALTARTLGGDQQHAQAELRAIIESSARTDHVLDEAVGRLYLSFSLVLDGALDEARVESIDAANAARRCRFVPLAGLAEATFALAALLQDDTAAALDAATAALPLGANARWESSIRVVNVLVRQRAGDAEGARRAAVDLIDLAVELGNPFAVFDAVAGLAGYQSGNRQLDAARATLEHASLTRTPLIHAALLDVAAQAEFDLGVDRFTDAFDPERFRRRCDGAVAHLVANRDALAA
jgi:predicted ATPase